MWVRREVGEGGAREGRESRRRKGLERAGAWQLLNSLMAPCFTSLCPTVRQFFGLYGMKVKHLKG